jgi:hypothetical protein
MLCACWQVLVFDCDKEFDVRAMGRITQMLQCRVCCLSEQ